MNDSLSLAVHAFASRVSMSFSVDEHSYFSFPPLSLSQNATTAKQYTTHKNIKLFSRNLLFKFLVVCTIIRHLTLCSSFDIFSGLCMCVCMCVCVCENIYPPHPQVKLLAWISLTLSRHPSLSSIILGRSSRLHPVSAQSCCR